MPCKARPLIGAILLIMCLIPVCGCLRSVASKQNESAEKAPSVRLAKPSDGELSAEETAVACLATSTELQKGGHLREAILLLEKARQNDPQLNVSTRLATLYAQAGQNSKARSEFKKALKQAPKDADLANDYGYFLMSNNQLDEAETWFVKALQLQSNHERATNNLGVCLGHQGRQQEALEQFNKILSPAEAYSNLGIILAQNGQVAEARQALQTALTHDPMLEQPRAGIAFLDKNARDSKAVNISEAAHTSVR